MSNGLNKVMLLGRIGADPELRFTQGGQAVLNMRLATTESYLDKDKVRKERTDWHTVCVWGKRAEGLAKFLTKGSLLFVEGSIRTSSYDDREGNKRYKTEIVANNVVLAGSKGGSGGDSDGEGGGAPETQGHTQHTTRSSGPIASAADLDGQHGNPTVRFDPRAWKGSSFKGRTYSECDPEFLETLAESLDYSAGHPKPGKEQYAKNDARDAARARGWAERLRKSGGGGNASRGGAPRQAQAPSHDDNASDTDGGGGEGYVGDYGGGDDLPF